MLLERIPSLRRSGPLIAAIFLIGLGLGAVVIALAQSRGGGHGSTLRTDRSGHVAAGAPQINTSATGGTGPSSTSQPAPSYSPLAPPGASASFTRLQAQLPGAIGIAVIPLGQGSVQTFGPLQVGHAWSTMKVPVLSTYIRQAENGHQPLSPLFRELATRAVEHSDNAAVNTVFSALEQRDGGLVGASQGVQQTLQLANDTTTQINTVPNNEGFSTFGQTEWSASDSAIFYRALARGCLLSPVHTSYLLNLMRNVESDQRWGAGAAGFPTTVAIKGGWGPERDGGYLVRQTAVIGAGDHGYVLSMIAKPDTTGTESFDIGQQMLTRTATWARRTFDLSARRPAVSCESER